jgi:hypothetical protein
MEYKIDIIELKDFHNLVDNIIEGIEKGNILANPLKREFTDLGDVVVAETATEKGEETREEVDSNITIKITLNNLVNLGGTLKEDKTIILYHKDTLEIVEVYLDAAKAATSQNIHQTTVRTRSKSKYVDPTGIVWTYYYEGLIPKENLGSDFDIDKPKQNYLTGL